MRNHELFPGTEDKPGGPEVVKILVTRQENGTMMQSPFGYVPAEELPDVATLFAKYGGGVYELIARNDKQITGRVSLRLPGDPKSLGPTPAAAPYALPVPGAVAATPPAGASMALAAIAALTPVLLGFFQMQSDSANRQMQMIMSVMNAKSNDSQQFVQMMQAASASQQAQMLALFSQIGKAGGADGAENTLLRGVQLAMELRQGVAEGAGGADDGGGIVDTLQKVMAMLKETKALADAGVTPPGVPRINVPGVVETEAAPALATDEETEAAE